MSRVAFVLVDLVADAAFCIAAPEFAGEIDKPVALHPRTRHALVPASGLIGSLRAHAERVAGGEAAASLFGSLDEDDRDGVPSMVRALGAQVSRSGGPVQLDDLEVRRQTKIDRRRGAAAATSLRKSQTVPAGADVRLYLEARDAERLDQVLAVLTSWQPTIGGGRTSGLGRATVTTVKAGVLDTATEKGLELLLSRSGPDLVEAVARDVSPVDAPAREPLREYRFQLASPVLVKGELDGKAVAALRRNGVPHIDGSTWKGIFRSGCEAVVNSVAEALGQSMGDTSIERLFGSVRRRGVLRFSETTITGAESTDRIHVSIDRVTGGAAENRLFQDKPVHRGEVVVTVEVDGEAPEWAGILLDAVAVDIHDGLVGVGGMTARGYGWLRLVDNPPIVDLRPWVDALSAEEGE